MNKDIAFYESCDSLFIAEHCAWETSAQNQGFGSINTGMYKIQCENKLLSLNNRRESGFYWKTECFNRY